MCCIKFHLLLHFWTFLMAYFKLKLKAMAIMQFLFSGHSPGREQKNCLPALPPTHLQMKFDCHIK
jgi:hypothetical protein